MRHFKRGRKLNRTSSHRSALLSNLAATFVINKHIVTTEPKAKELRSFAERLVTYAKKNSLHGRRLILKNIKGRNSKKIADILIHDLAPNYTDRNGGYTRIIKLDNRKNDNAKICIIEFVNLKNTDSEDSSEEKQEKTE
ncbi:MAG: 50S ribosomal protein L17 [Candidatus Marinimicrobia bacterium]|nr:50S ribosomal protein L17 [Candidatus Neomarinimicrobiota bacterium]|tara:strand:+ start:29259 stop:29675 length:417 start_codon:yes stop_codon:yes gene_type:complete